MKKIKKERKKLVQSEQGLQGSVVTLELGEHIKCERRGKTAIRDIEDKIGQIV